MNVNIQRIIFYDSVTHASRAQLITTECVKVCVFCIFSYIVIFLYTCDPVLNSSAVANVWEITTQPDLKKEKNEGEGNHGTQRWGRWLLLSRKAHSCTTYPNLYHDYISYFFSPFFCCFYNTFIDACLIVSYLY